MQSDSNTNAVIGGVILLAVLLSLYFLPLIVAAVRKVPHVGSIAVVNALLGWTLVGWIIALAMATRSNNRTLVVNQYATAPGGPRWQPDPTGRHQHRFWDGGRWTQYVRDDGDVGTIDPM